MDIRFIAAAAILPLAACATTDSGAEPAPAPVAMTCNADGGETFVGQIATVDVGTAIVKATGARTIRWGPPRSAMTMDYRQDRVNVMYDDAYKIEKVTCG